MIITTVIKYIGETIWRDEVALVKMFEFTENAQKNVCM